MPQDFNDFLEPQLESSNGTNFLLIGEDHKNSSALIALAHSVDIIAAAIKRGKTVIVLTEDLHQKRNWFNQVSDYKAKDLTAVKKTLGEDAEAAEKLVKSGVFLFGLENNKTAPTLEGKTKVALFNSAVKLMPAIFKKFDGTPDLERMQYLENLKNDPAFSLQNFEAVLHTYHGSSNERISSCNEEITAQLVQLSKSTKSQDTLVIFAGGNAHLPLATQEGHVISQGVVSGLQQKMSASNVNYCSVNAREFPKGYSTYDPYVKLEIIPLSFQTPRYYPSTSAESLAKLGDKQAPSHALMQEHKEKQEEIKEVSTGPKSEPEAPAPKTPGSYFNPK